jgi:putative tricarboxylic transport membrane protein
MGKKEIFFGILLMVGSATMFALTFQFPQQTIALPPTAFPRFVGTCLFILATILLIQGILGAKHTPEHHKTVHKLDKTFLLRFTSMIVLAFAYTRILPLTGYVIATPPFVAGTMLLFNEKRWIWIGVISLITSLVLYVLFRMIFKVPLPRFNLW